MSGLTDLETSALLTLDPIVGDGSPLAQLKLLEFRVALEATRLCCVLIGPGPTAGEDPGSGVAPFEGILSSLKKPIVAELLRLRY